MSSPRTAITLLALVLAVACAAITKPESLDQRLAYAYGVHTAVLQAAATSVEIGTLSSTEGETVLRLADNSKALLASARLASQAGDPTTAQGQLNLAITVLTELQDYLHAKARTTP